MFDLEAHEALTAKATEAEFYETDRWAADAILDVELLTPDVLDPCAGRGVLGQALRGKGYNRMRIIETDLNEWPGQPACIRPGVDFLASTRIPAAWRDFTVFMNPPFSLATEFVQQSLEIGARKVVMFQRMAFMESSGRREFFQETPPARVWICGSRATCWRGDIPDEDIVIDPDQPAIKNNVVRGKKGRSAATPHAWFVWERGHRGAMTTQAIYKD